ncbi:MAG: hypothetical protein LBJ91_05015 [Clostridiales Family XIII bacterium]|jgi:hypothetical protein|nr:hypothetical protein [Clostridiales Family XIII bacterium]
MRRTTWNEEKTPKRMRKIVLAGVALAALLFVLSPPFADFVGALWNEEEAVHVDPPTIENGTLAIGAHLVHIKALTEDLYNIATESAGESGQNRIYYKSELNGGAWCDITEADSLAAISTAYADPNGNSPITVVNDSVIEALFFLYHTKSDGITYDLRDGNAVNLFGLTDPYDLQLMPELEPLKLQYDLYTQMQAGTEDGDARIERIDLFWGTDVHTENSNQYDLDLEALQSYYTLVGQDEDANDKLAAIQGVMSSVDAARRAETLGIVETTLTGFVEEVQSTTTAAFTDADLRTALNDSLLNVQTSLTEQEGRMLSQGVTELSNVRYTASMSLIQHAKDGDNAACGVDVAKLIDLTNIESGSIVNQESEASLLSGELIPGATQRLTALLYAGENAEYAAAGSAGAVDAVLRAVATEALAGMNMARGELESFISGYARRVNAEDSVTFVDARITLTTDWFDGIPNDAFFENSSSCVNDHIEFLTNLKRQLEIALGGSELDQLMEQKAAAQTEYMDALDRNDLAGAKAAEDKIAGIDAQIAAIENETNAQISNLEREINGLEASMNDAGSDEAKANLSRRLDMTNAELRALTASLSPDSVGNLVSSTRGDALDIISNGGNTAELSSIIDSLGGMLDMNFKTVFPALKDLHDAMQKRHALEGTNQFADQLEAAGQLIADNQADYDAAISGEKSAEDLQALMDGLDGAGGLGDDTGMGADGRAVAYINALKEYGEATGGENIPNLMRAEAQRQMNLGNPLVYKKAEDPATRYLPVTAIRSYRGMRYVWNRNQNKATLARGADYYAFTAWSVDVLRGRNEADVEAMESPTSFLGVVYVPESYTEAQFECHPVYLPDSDLGILMGADIQELSDELLELFLS